MTAVIEKKKLKVLQVPKPAKVAGRIVHVKAGGFRPPLIVPGTKVGRFLKSARDGAVTFRPHEAPVVRQLAEECRARDMPFNAESLALLAVQSGIGPEATIKALADVLRP